MTIATDLGFKIGELYRVVSTESGYYVVDEIVMLTEDDGTPYPWFHHVSGPRGGLASEAQRLSIRLDQLVPVEHPKISANKPLLLLYIQQQYPDDKVLKALISAL